MAVAEVMSTALYVKECAIPGSKGRVAKVEVSID